MKVTASSPRALTRLANTLGRRIPGWLHMGSNLEVERAGQPSGGHCHLPGLRVAQDPGLVVSTSTARKEGSKGSSSNQKGLLNHADLPSPRGRARTNSFTRGQRAAGDAGREVRHRAGRPWGLWTRLHPLEET